MFNPPAVMAVACFKVPPCDVETASTFHTLDLLLVMCYQVMLHFFMAAESVSDPVHENVCEDKVNEFCVSALIQYSECFVAPFAAFPFAGRQNNLFVFFG